MNGFFIRLLITAAGLWVASGLAGVHIVGLGTLLIAALLLGIVNAIIRPILIVLTLPITILSLGFFLLIINAMMVGLVAALLRGFSIDGLGWAILASIIVTITGWMGNAFVGNKGGWEMMGSHRDRH
jgi:putative membrane protein